MKPVQLSTINLVSFREERDGGNRRRPGRVRCERLACHGGRVLDLSLTGARLHIRSWTPPREGQNRLLVFETAMGPSHPFPSVVRWVKPVGRRRFEVGVEFRGLDEVRCAELREMSRVHGGRTVLGNIDQAA